MGWSEICSELPRQVLGCWPIGPGGLSFLYQRFSSLLRDEACQFRNQQSRTVVKFGDHSSIGDSWPIAFSGYPRGPRVGGETQCPKHATPNFSAETRSRTRVSREPDGHRQRNPQRWSGLDQRHSSCLWFQILGVEAHSSLPHHQHDGGHLPGQGQTRHFRPNTLGQQSCVELLKRTGFARGEEGRALKQILQIVIAVVVQSANGNLFLRSLQLPVDTTVIGAAVGGGKGTRIMKSTGVVFFHSKLCWPQFTLLLRMPVCSYGRFKGTSR